MKKKNKKDNYKSRRKRIFFLILLLMAMIGTSSFFTYAWFSSNKNAIIETIDINVATVTGLQVSVDAIEWGNDISKDMLINAYKTYPRAINQFPDTMNGVSTVGTTTDGLLDMYYGITTESSENVFTLTTTKQNEINCTGDEECEGRKYVAFDMFLLVTAPAQIGITAASKVAPQEDAQDKGSQNAARIGFVLNGTVGANASIAAQNLRGDGKSYIWEPNYDVHTESGVKNAKLYYGLNTTVAGASRLPYKGVNREFNTPVRLDETDSSPYFSDVTPDVATTKTFSTNQHILTVPAGISKLRIYLWLEGQDVDMENDASASKLSFDLELAMLN